MKVYFSGICRKPAIQGLVRYNLLPIRALASFAYPKEIETVFELPTEGIMIDSGAFSAAYIGKEIDIDAYSDFLRTVRNRIDIAVSLDVLPNTKPVFLGEEASGKMSLENYLYLKSKNLNVLPVFHYGESWDILEEYLSHTDFVGIGGAVRMKLKPHLICDWLREAFSRYSFKAHGFGINNMEILSQFAGSLVSVDSTTWMVGTRFGQLVTPQGLLRISSSGRELPVGRYNEIVRWADENYGVDIRALAFKEIDFLNIKIIRDILENGRFGGLIPFTERSTKLW